VKASVLDFSNRIGPEVTSSRRLYLPRIQATLLPYGAIRASRFAALCLGAWADVGVGRWLFGLVAACEVVLINPIVEVGLLPELSA